MEKTLDSNKYLHILEKLAYKRELISIMVVDFQ